MPGESPEARTAPDGGRPGLARYAWPVYLAGLGTIVCVYVLARLAGGSWLSSGLVFNLIGGSSVVALIVGAKENSPRARLPWYLLAIGQAMFVTSDVLESNYERLFGSAISFPSVADSFHLAFYPFLVGGMLLLVHQRRESRDRGALIDSLTVTLGLATLLWVYLISPYISSHTLSVSQRTASAAYPAMDILVLSVVARMASGSHRREPAFDFMLGATTLLLLSDALHGARLLHGHYAMTAPTAGGWAAFYVLLGTAALHPSMRMLSEPGRRANARLTPLRLALLACTSLTVPMLIVLRAALGESYDLYVLIGASASMFALVLLRMAGIVRRNEESIRREASLRRAGEALVSATGRDEIYASALQAARSVVDEDVSPVLYLVEDDRLVAARGCEEACAAQPALSLPVVQAMARARLQDCAALNIDGTDGTTICLAPLLVRERLTGALGVLAEDGIERSAEEALGSLATAVALALQSAALIEETLTRRSEERLSSLIRNSSDFVCILAVDGTVRFASPSVERMFGHQPVALLDRDISELVHPEDLQRMRALLAATASGRPQSSGQSPVAEFRIWQQSKQRWRDVEALATNLLQDGTIEGIVLNIRDISERKAFQDELEHQAFHDTLTGLPNRALFRNRVEHALLGRRRDRLPVAILFLDIDDFKYVNDSLGHASGDIVLQEVARRLEDCMRPVDTAARIGGDEFAILIRDAESELQAIEIAQRLMSAVAAPIALDGRDLALATSIGIAFSDQHMVSSRDADELLRNADAAMYMAKESGKAGYRIFEPEMHARAMARLELKSDLQRALDAGEFTLRYQPIMDIARGDMAGMEALARWEHPERGELSPTEFVPLLEETGLIVQVGHHILLEACAWAAHMQRECPREPPLSMAVNVSARQLQRAEFIGEVEGALKATHIVPNSLTLELTESVMMQDMEVSLMRLEALRRLGVKLAIDDFGTGYSSLNYVRELPVDILKIDRSFLADKNPQVAEMTASIVELARIFNLKAVAEGVETIDQLERLEGMQCDFGQGFHFARPLHPEQILAMASGEDPLQVPAPARRDR
jgi:diguanylate cyclase (GGDEF)-like protein/PAS domain S-box-containing protein